MGKKTYLALLCLSGADTNVNDNCVHLLSSSPRPALNRLTTNPGLVSFQTPSKEEKRVWQI